MVEDALSHRFFSKESIQFTFKASGFCNGKIGLQSVFGISWLPLHAKNVATPCLEQAFNINKRSSPARKLNWICLYENSPRDETG